MLMYLTIIDSKEGQQKFEFIYNRYKKLMFYIANKILGDTRDSEDTVHDAFLKIIEIIDDIKDVESPQTRSLIVMLPAFAASEPDDVPAAAIGHACAINTNATFAASDEIPEEIIIEGEPGDFFVVGDLVFEIVTPEEVESVVTAPETRASTSRWSISLSGTEMSKGIEVTSSYPHAKVWVDNKGSQSIKFTITKGSETGSVVKGTSVSIAAGTSTSVYSTNKWPADTYYANFTCGKAEMKGSAACRVASTIPELDI